MYISESLENYSTLNKWKLKVNYKEEWFQKFAQLCKAKKWLPHSCCIHFSFHWYYTLKWMKSCFLMHFSETQIECKLLMELPLIFYQTGVTCKLVWLDILDWKCYYMELYQGHFLIVYSFVFKFSAFRGGLL